MVGVTEEEEAVVSEEEEGSGERGKEVRAAAERGEKAGDGREVAIKEEEGDDDNDGDDGDGEHRGHV